MQELRRTIRNILFEEFACASITNPNIGDGIAELERQGFYISSHYSPEEYDSGVANSIGLYVYNDNRDEIAWWLGEFQVTGDHCLGAFQCTNADAQWLKGTGVGALLYDVACELVGKAGLSSDRNEVSDAAWKMWKYMTLNDQTYDIKGTYDWDGEQTPDDLMDDCMSISWEDHDDEWKNPTYNPLNQVFVKKDQSRPTIKCLIEKGLIEFEG